MVDLKHRLTAAGAAVLAVLVILAPTLSLSADNLPNIGDPSEQLITPEEEHQLGEAVLRHMRQSQQLVDDPELQGYIQSLGYRLAANSDNPTQPFTFFLIDDPEINAAAWIGGFIGVNSGLVLATQSESELSAVLAHEIAHVTQRHVQRFYQAGERLSLPQLAALIAAILVGTQNSELGQAAITSLAAGSAQYQINFTRTHEYEADRIGMQTLANADFDPYGMPSFFERLQDATRYGRRPPEFLSTHPLTEARVAESLARASQLPHHFPTNELNYWLARTKLYVRTAKDAEQLVKHFEEALKTGRYANLAAEQYGYALALRSAGRLDESRTLLQRLLKDDPDRPAYLLALAKVELDAGHTATALSAYKEDLSLYPNHHALTMAYGEALIKSGRAAEAHTLLREHLRYSPNDPNLYESLARAASLAGHPGEGHGYMAEHYYLNGQTHAAVEQLELALRDPALNFYQQTQFETRLRTFKQEIREEAQDKNARNFTEQSLY